MNNKLSDTFDLPDYQQPSSDDILVAMENAKELEKSLNEINGFDQHDIEMDELSDLAITAHKDLLELGMNVDSRLSGEIFSTSATMLKIAVDAKNNKVDKKLRLLKLQLDKMKFDRSVEKDKDTPVDGGELTLDRNELIAQIQKAIKPA